MKPKTETNRDQAMEQIAAFEARYGYDASYMKEMAEHALAALDIFNGFTPMAGHRNQAPLEVYFTAKITAYAYADCGPCYQLAIDFAKEAGVANELLDALVNGKEALPRELETIRAFTIAVLEAHPECDSLRAEIEARYGRATVIELGLVIAAAQVFPVVKRSMGHFKSCGLVSVNA